MYSVSSKKQTGLQARVCADPVLLHELVTNLVDNAVHYCPTGARVTVRVCTDPQAGRVRHEVEDNGPGIPLAERPRVLERFYRMSGMDQEGSGLGLAIVRDVAERYGGTVNLCESDSGGLLVRIDLPWARPGQAG